MNTPGPTLEDVQREFPRWHAWRGIAGLVYARKMLSSPPAVVRAEDPAGLREAIRAAIGQEGWAMDIYTLHDKHQGRWQIRAMAGGSEPPVWQARPWPEDSQDPWTGRTRAAATAPDAESLDAALLLLEQHG